MKNTRKLLVSSLIMILSCCLLFAGTTFAWFSDSVTSGNNIITAGNLDVELEYSKDGSSWFGVDETTKLFKTDTLWEPGHVEAVVLKVTNAGSLALKYSVSLDTIEVASINVASEELLLSKHLVLASKVTMDEEVTAVKDRPSALKFAAENKKQDKFDTVLEGTLIAGESNYIQLVIAMPETVGNEANYRKGEVAPKIKFKLNLFATQLNNEKDSFGPEYDQNAPLPWLGNVSTAWVEENEGTEKDPYIITNADELAGLAALVNGTATLSRAAGSDFNGKTFTLTKDIDLAGIAWTPIGSSAVPFKGNFNGNGHTIYNLNVEGNNSCAGLFGHTQNGKIENVHVHNATVSGRLSVGVVAGQPYTTSYSNITVTGKVIVEGFAYVGGVFGRNVYANIDNVTVNVTEDSYVNADSRENGIAYRTYVGGVIGFMGEGSHVVSNVTSNINVLGSTIDVGGIVGIAHYNNTFINCKSTGNVTITSAEADDEALEIGGIAGVWHNENGTKVTLKYCSFEGELTTNRGVDLSKNTLVGASYNTTGTGELVIVSADINGVECEQLDIVVDIRDFTNFNIIEQEKQINDITVYTFEAEKFQAEYPVEEYADWTCDFFVSTDKGVKEGIVLAGAYGSFGWIGFNAPASEEAYENVGLLGVVSHNNESNWTYANICEFVNVFQCGIIDTSANNDNAGVNVTVVLRMTNKTTGEKIDVWSFTTSLCK